MKLEEPTCDPQNPEDFHVPMIRTHSQIRSPSLQPFFARRKTQTAFQRQIVNVLWQRCRRVLSQAVDDRKANYGICIAPWEAEGLFGKPIGAF